MARSTIMRPSPGRSITYPSKSLISCSVRRPAPLYVLASLTRCQSEARPRAPSVPAAGGAAPREDPRRGLRSQGVLDPPVEDRGIRARLDAGAVVLRERDPGPRDQPQQRIAEALELALAEAVELALAEAALEDLLRERGERCLACGLSLHDQRLQSPLHGL